MPVPYSIECYSYNWDYISSQGQFDFLRFHNGFNIFKITFGTSRWTKFDCEHIGCLYKFIKNQRGNILYIQFAVTYISIFIVFLLGYVHFFMCQVPAPEVQQDLRVSSLGICVGLESGTLLCIPGAFMDHL